MSQLVEFSLRDGGTVLVEVETGAASGADVTSPGGPITGKAATSFEEALDKIRPAIERVVGSLASLEPRPDEFSVELGIGMTATLGAFISIPGTSNLLLRLTWRNRS